jgi:hypothetical protein
VGILLPLQRHFSALTKFAHVESRFCGRKGRGKAAFDVPVNPCVRSVCSRSVAVGLRPDIQLLIIGRLLKMSHIFLDHKIPLLVSTGVIGNNRHALRVRGVPHPESDAPRLLPNLPGQLQPDVNAFMSSHGNSSYLVRHSRTRQCLRSLNCPPNADLTHGAITLGPWNASVFLTTEMKVWVSSKPT